MNKSQEDCPEDGIHLQELAWDDIVTLHRHRATVHISTGTIPLFPPVYNMKVVLPIEVEVPSIGVLPTSKLDWAQNIWRPCTTTKRGWNKIPTRGFVPIKFKRKTLCPKRYYLSNRTPRASGRLAMKAHVRWLLQLWMVANLHVQWKPMQSRNTLSKNKKLDKSQIWKDGLGKNERLGGLKIRKGGPGKN